MNFNKTLITLVLTSLLAACGGNDGSGTGLQAPGGGGGGGGDGGGGGGGGGSGGEASPTDVSYLPLLVYEAFKEFSGGAADGYFSAYGQDPFIDSILINPVNALTLAHTDDATLDDFDITVNSAPIDESENFPMLQKVLGNKINLRTALVFDLSGSTDPVNVRALVDEAKAYVAAAQNSSNSTIANQEFMVWSFGRQVEAKLLSFTSDIDDINTALEAVVTDAASKRLGLASNLNRAVVQAVGRYTKDTYLFGADGDNDLEDYACMDYVMLSQMVIFSSGPDTFQEMNAELMEKAISSQSFTRYDQTVSSGDTLAYLKKPVFYYVTGGATRGVEYEALSENAEFVEHLVLNAGAYSFAEGLIEGQIEAIDARIDLDSQYVVRYAFLPRAKGTHELAFKSKATAGYNFTLTGKIKFEVEDASGTPAEELDSLVEITGPQGEYLAAGFDGSSVEIDIAEIDSFAPATRWTNQVYSPVADYAWEPQDGIDGEVNEEGIFTVSAITEDGLQLTLRNIRRGVDGPDDDILPDGETFTITLNDSRD